MSNATNISLARDDGTSVTLVPVSSLTDQKGVTTLLFRELNATKPLAACVRLTITMEELKSGVIRTTRKLEMPILKIIPAGAVSSNGYVAAPEVSHVETDIRIRYHHPLSTPTERADSLRMANHADSSGHVTANWSVNPSLTTAYTYRDVAAGYQLLFADINYVWPSA